jgi:hypothetical protein
VAVARALGGTDWRNGGISDVADYARVSVRPRHRFVLLASDGVVSALEDGSKDASADRSEPLAWRVAAAQAAGVRAADIARGLVTCVRVTDANASERSRAAHVRDVSCARFESCLPCSGGARREHRQHDLPRLAPRRDGAMTCIAHAHTNIQSPNVPTCKWHLRD